MNNGSCWRGPGKLLMLLPMNDSTNDATQALLDPNDEGLKLPAGIDLLEKVGKGRVCTVYKARFQGETVALKAYKAAAADWYRKTIDKNIAVFEMMQNRAFRSQPDLVNYTAKPIRVIGQDGKASLCFVQEYVEGITIEELGDRYGKIPGYLLKTGEAIARACEEHSLEGVDYFVKGVKLRQSASTWMPVMFDFKHIPSDQPKKGKQSLLQRIGLSKKPVGPGGFMSEWEALALQLEKDAL